MKLCGQMFILSPSDLVASAACPHLLQLEMAMACGQLAVPAAANAQSQTIARRGNQHETAYLSRLQEAGCQVTIILAPGRAFPESAEADAEATRQAIAAGAELIYQPTFLDGSWSGRADFLERVNQPSDLGAWRYEVVDTKLARHVQPGAVLQLGLYGLFLARLQGVAPTWLHLELGNGERVSIEARTVLAYTRQRRTMLEASLSEPLETYPHPVAHCAVCRWEPDCVARRRADDHPSLIAGMRREQVEKLAAVGVATLVDVARADLDKFRLRIGAHTLARLRAQARLQLRQRETGQVEYELLPPGPGLGLARLPEPDPGDVFFDMEGDPLMQDGGLEYLFGAVVQVASSSTFKVFWAHDRQQEKDAFEAFVAWVTARRQQHPGMHIYHYAPYERTALSNLALRHGTCEAEVDAILRGEVLVDLYQVVRQGILVSQESYSIKKLEPLYMGARKAAVKDAGSSIVEYERYVDLVAAGAAADERATVLDGIAKYNEEDCISTLKLRDWLESLRAGLMIKEPLLRPMPATAVASEAKQDAAEEVEALVRQLCTGLPEEVELRTPSEKGRALLAQLLRWHEREARPEWWAYFSRQSMGDEELAADGESLAGIAYVGPVGSVARSTLHAYQFNPDQEHKIMSGHNYEEPATGKSHTIHEIDRAEGRLTVKVGKGKPAPAIATLIPGKPLYTSVQKEALQALARACLDPDQTEFQAALALLRLDAPRLAGHSGGEVVPADASTEQLRGLACQLRGSYLAVQGPPGTGKSYLGARMIVSLLGAGRSVAITGPSHRVISNLLLTVVNVAAAEGVALRAGQRCDRVEEAVLASAVQQLSNEQIECQLESGELNLIAGTIWLMARPALRGAVDSLVIDEAGQMSLANAMAASTSAHNLILLGDPQQLAQPSRAAHPGGSGVSVLAHVLAGQATMPKDRGLFLRTTRRMHPEICAFISSTFYDDRLLAHPDCGRQRIDGPDPAGFTGAGLRWLPVAHVGRTSHAPEEVMAVVRLVEQLMGQKWTGQQGGARPLMATDILVVAPFNVQVAALRAALPPAVSVGTVDKFQGREAPVVVYSLTCSTADDAPRGMAFLYGLDRLNVAVSRAQGMAILVCTPALLGPDCRTLRDMQMANALCTFVEAAAVGGRGPIIMTASRSLAL